MFFPAYTSSPAFFGDVGRSAHLAGPAALSPEREERGGGRLGGMSLALYPLLLLHRRKVSYYYRNTVQYVLRSSSASPALGVALTGGEGPTDRLEFFFLPSRRRRFSPR